jgi:hypothetical protein
MIAVLAAVATGCGSSTGTTDQAEAGLTNLLKPIAREMRHNPKTAAYEAALGELKGDDDPRRIRRKIVALLPKMSAYVAYLRSVPFPSCARAIQRGMTGMVARSENMERGALPVLATGDKAAMMVYLEAVHNVTKAEIKALHELGHRVEKAIGGNDHC